MSAPAPASAPPPSKKSSGGPRIFECVPNFSNGRDAAVIRAIVDAAASVPGVRVLDIESNADHNRSVLSLVGEGSALSEGAFRATKKAAELIDLTQHHGEHPRMGAMDVVPFIPLGEATMEEAVALAAALGERIARELSIPVFLYGKAARVAARGDLAYVRQGEFEGLRQSIPSDPARRPDFGPSAVHPTAGAIAVGARPVLIAYNLYLNTPDVNIAKKVARAIRARDGGLAEVKALGFEIKERGKAQVSINMTDYRRTPLQRVFEMVRSEAERYGVSIEETEVVGLVPDDALLDAAEHYLRLNQFDRHNVLERKLDAGQPNLLRDASVARYLEELSLRKPTPGGGSAAALVGAMGAALGEMVLRYSGPADKLVPQALESLATLAELRQTLTAGIDRDAQAYDEVRATKRALKESGGAVDAKAAYHGALDRAARVPLSIAQAAHRARELLRAVRALAKPIMISDYTAALAFLDAAITGATDNVKINLVSLQEEGIPTEEFATALRQLGVSG